MRSIEKAVSAQTVQLQKLPANISLHKRFYTCGVIMNQFPHTVTRVTNENAVEIKTYRFIWWAECGAASVVFLNISVVAGGIWTG